MFTTSVLAQETKMSLTIQPASSISSGGEAIFPVKSVNHQFEAGDGGTFDFASPGGGSVKIVFFVGTTQVTLDFFIDSYDQSEVIASRPLPSKLNVVGGFVYDMRTFEGISETLTFDSPFAMTVGYLDSQIEDLDEETLNIYFWNETNNAWETFASSSLNTIDNTITIFTDHLTLFATLGEEIGILNTGSNTATAGGGSGGGGGGGMPVFQPDQSEEEPPATQKTASKKRTPLINTEEAEASIPRPGSTEAAEEKPERLLDIDFGLEGGVRSKERNITPKVIGAGIAATITYWLIRRKYARRV